MAELIKGDFDEEKAQAIAAALAKICGVKKPSQLAHVDDEDIAAVAVEAKLPKVGVKMLAQIIASKAAPKAAGAAHAAETIATPPPPRPRSVRRAPPPPPRIALVVRGCVDRVVLLSGAVSKFCHR